MFLVGTCKIFEFTGLRGKIFQNKDLAAKSAGQAADSVSKIHAVEGKVRCHIRLTRLREELQKRRANLVREIAAGTFLEGQVVSRAINGD